jgi:hypothetical protein
MADDKYPYARGLLGFGALDPLSPFYEKRPLPGKALADLVADIRPPKADPFNSFGTLLGNGPSARNTLAEARLD